MAETSTIENPADLTTDQLAGTNAYYETLTAEEILLDALAQPWFSRPAVVSSFGAEAVALLSMVARVQPDIPVIFIDTGKLFGETLRYRDRLQHVLGLEDVRIVGPRRKDVEEHDPLGVLNRSRPDKCCEIRKVDVLARAMKHHDSWINGRKRFQNDVRSDMKIIERDENDRLKLTPLANWDAKNVKDYITEHNLPIHPLVAQGYLSIGCFPCTSKVSPGQDARSGRWEGQGKTECGIHNRPKK